MAKIALSNSTFSIVPEGTHIFQITAVNFKEDFGKLEITMKTAQGATHIERFTFVKNDGSPNETAVNIFSYLAKTAMQDYDLEEIDHEELVGRFIKAEVTHDVLPNKNDPTKTVTFTRLGNKYTADGFEDVPAKPVKTASATVKPTGVGIPATAPAPGKKKVDLASILGKK